MQHSYRPGDIPTGTDPTGSRPWSTLESVDEADPPHHCGAAMVRRRLDFTDLHGRANQAIAQAAVDRRHVLACPCGFLREVPAGRDGSGLIPDGVDAILFSAFFGRRVLAAAGRVESAEWDLDQLLARQGAVTGPAPSPSTTGSFRRDPVVEAGWWRLDQANRSLVDELVLAAAHRVPTTVLAREAGLDAADVRAMLDDAGWVDDAAGVPTDTPVAAPTGGGSGRTVATPVEAAVSVAAVLTAVFDSGDRPVVDRTDAHGADARVAAAVPLPSHAVADVLTGRIDRRADLAAVS